MDEPDRNQLLSPILIGITGHTQIRPDDVAVLQTAVAKILGGLREKYPHTPLLLVCSLAEGADQLCAGVALDMGLEVMAPLPFPLELYGTRFVNESAKKKLRELTQNKHVHSFVPALAHTGRADPAQVIQDDRLRGQRYTEVGLFVAQYSHAMIALWDGDHGANSSLTAELVEFKTRGQLPAKIKPDKHTPEFGLVFSIFTPHPNQALAGGKQPGSIHMLPEGRDIETSGLKSSHLDRIAPQKLFDNICNLTERLNQDIRHCPLAGEDDLLKAVPGATPVQINLLKFRRLVAGRNYRYKFRVDVAYLIVYSLVFFGAIFFHAYGDYHQKPGDFRLIPWLFYASLACFGGALIYSFLDDSRARENQRLDYRALAEALRVQFYWHFAGLSLWVPDHYLQRQRSELDWILLSTRAWALRLQAEVPPAGGVAPHKLETVNQLWISGQAKFYEKSRRKNENAYKFCKLISTVFLYLALIASALLFWPLSTVQPPERPVPYTVILSALLLIAAMTAAYAEQRLFAMHARHFGNMGSLFRLAEQRTLGLLAKGHNDEVASIFQKMGEESLAENTEWLILHRIRHFEVPIP